MLRTCARIIALTAMVVGPTAQAADETLTLACKGTVQRNAMKSEPVSIGIIVNFTARTITGFTLPTEKLPLTMLNFNDTTVQFSGSDSISSLVIDGIIDRVTGDLEATAIRQPSITETTAATTIERYSLKCRPAQRMF
jgi:hypothetical protein